MNWEPSHSLKELQRAVDKFDHPAAAELCDALIDSARSGAAVFPEGEARAALAILRRKRYFDLLQSVAEALIENGQTAPVVQRQYAQALIDQGQLVVASSLLRQLAEDTRNDPVEHAEARGLLGRVYKQQYVRATSGSAERRAGLLRNAVAAYSAVYLLDEQANFWPGINTVACVCRARRDGVRIDGAPEPDVVAREMLARFTSVDPGTLDVWRLATAAEACIALGEYDDALRWTNRYVSKKDEFGKPAADAFEIASTLRQLKEVWQLTMDDGPGTSLLPLLEAHLLLRSGGSLQGASADFRKTAANANLEKLEAILGNVSYRPAAWLKTGLERSAAVGRITNQWGTPIGTGFLVRYSDVGGDSEEPVLVTNSHVVSPQRDWISLQPQDAVVTLEGDATKQYQVSDVLWNSRSGDLDTTVARLACPPDVALAAYPSHCAPFPWADTLPPVESEPRVYVIGYPGGGPLSFSFEDNLLLDYDDRLAQYRAPTIGGSSGSPVFDADWKLVALHHAGGKARRRLKGPGTHPANEGILMSAIRDGVRQRQASGQ